MLTEFYLNSVDVQCLYFTNNNTNDLPYWFYICGSKVFMWNQRVFCGTEWKSCILILEGKRDWLQIIQDFLTTHLLLKSSTTRSVKSNRLLKIQSKVLGQKTGNLFY